MPFPQQVTIVGLGLMGGSLALALRPHIAKLIAVDANPLTCRQAEAQGVVDWATTDLARGVAGSGLVILATPVRVIARLLAQLPLLRPDGCLVLDLGSTKTAITQAMSQLPASFAAVGGHPMCGRETSGLNAADAALYEGQTFILCETARSTATAKAIVGQLLAWLGAAPLWLDSRQHDAYVAVVSHLPYVVSAALLRRAAQEADEDPRLWQVSASGFRDTGRLAGSEPRMMLDILLTNREAVLAQLSHFQSHLAEIAALIEAEDEVALRHWLAARQFEYGIYRSHKPPRGEEDNPGASKAPGL